MEGPFRESDLTDPALRVIETLRWDGAALQRRDRHLARARVSCERLGFRYRPEKVERALSRVAGPDPLRVRLTLARDGTAEVETAPLPPSPQVWCIALSAHRLDPDDPWLGHKTTRRALYDQTRASLPAGVDEALFLNRRGAVCEGTITNIFFDVGDGLQTPPLRCGLLPGVLREEMLAAARCREGLLYPDALTAARLWVGNALRGLIRARFVLETLPPLPHRRG